MSTIFLWHQQQIYFMWMLKKQETAAQVCVCVCVYTTGHFILCIFPQEGFLMDVSEQTERRE